MKITHILFLALASIFVAGCASTGGSEASAPASAPAPAPESSSFDRADAKTAYDGATGSGLLMERYKTGSIEGYRD